MPTSVSKSYGWHYSPAKIPNTGITHSRDRRNWSCRQAVPYVPRMSLRGRVCSPLGFCVLTLRFAQYRLSRRMIYPQSVSRRPANIKDGFLLSLLQVQEILTVRSALPETTFRRRRLDVRTDPHKIDSSCIAGEVIACNRSLRSQVETTV